MKDRWITLLLALGALAAFYFYFVGPKESAAENHSRPLATEMRANGYFAIRRWLETEGIPVTELRQRYDWLARARGLPRHGNPHHHDSAQAGDAARRGKGAEEMAARR